MARKKKSDEPADNGVPLNGTAVVDPPTETPAPQQPNGTPGDGQSAGQPTAQAATNRPAATFTALSDRTTCLEVAVWARKVKVGDQEEYTQYALSLSRSWRDRDGKWTQNSSYRVHDVPVLLFLVQQAYNFCVNARTEVRIGDEPLPF